MRTTSLLVLAEGFATVPQELLPTFEAQLSEREEPLASVKPHEAQSVVALVRALRKCGAQKPVYFEGFVFSFCIPQISSEFDLLKITDDTVVNIELKSVNVGAERISKQLTRTRHYLAPLNRTIRTFTFVSDVGELYERDEDGPVRRVGMERLVSTLGATGNAYEGQVEDLFKVSNYLVSPLNDTDRFLAGSYFLTNHQAQIKRNFLKACDVESVEALVFLVYGSAGTGKSLLLYDIARSLRLPSPACVIHCGVLADGHEALNERQHDFRIISAKRSERVDMSAYGALLVDEAQRLWPSQLKRIASAATSNGTPLYLSMDRRQVLVRREDAYDAEQVVRGLCPKVSIWELSRKIRTNRELVDFLRALFSLPGAPRFTGSRHVKVASASDAAAARGLVDAFRGEGYQFIALYPSDEEGAADELAVPGSLYPATVVGQEFDKVVMAVGPGFSMGDDRCSQLLYQGLTRARSDIAIVVYRNETFLRSLLALA